nr:DNA replication complex GINS protein PSF2 [Cryptococcus depauperatus CBS 7841]ODN98698.1 DNA replication complex GINS protein PSF2 [Cryptococcus depauperatus CBS 7855]
MALPKALSPSLTPNELTFIAEQYHINIIPLFSMTRVRLISGIYGPFQPPSAARVPLWMALSLKRKRKCRIVPPDWLTVEKLQDLFKSEKENGEGFERLPRRFMEISKVLLDTQANLSSPTYRAPDDVSQTTLLRSLLKDIREVRQAKIRMGLQSEDVLQSDYLQASLTASS